MWLYRILYKEFFHILHSLQGNMHTSGIHGQSNIQLDRKYLGNIVHALKTSHAHIIDINIHQNRHNNLIHIFHKFHYVSKSIQPGIILSINSYISSIHRSMKNISSGCIHHNGFHIVSILQTVHNIQLHSYKGRSSFEGHKGKCKINIDLPLDQSKCHIWKSK